MSEYNYSAEGMDEFRHALHVGDRVPDFDAVTPEGEQVKLFDYSRQGDFTVMEFGSLT
ncbi:MAG: hypothetical protein ACYDAG_16590 [Chloroflexota bacterium]